MMQNKLFFGGMLVCFMVTNCYSQTNPPVAEVFVGSTPCDVLVKSTLKIPADTPCEFIKWNLSLHTNGKDPDTYQLTALYGVSQPNTNGFIGGGEKISVTGKYTARNNLYRLTAENLQWPIFLIVMDKNILHFADSTKKFIVGNGGFGYVLNKVK